MFFALCTPSSIVRAELVYSVEAGVRDYAARLNPSPLSTLHFTILHLGKIPKVSIYGTLLCQIIANYGNLHN